MVSEHTVEFSVIVQVKNDTLKFVSCNEEGKTRTIFVKGDNMDIVSNIIDTHGTTETSDNIVIDIRKQAWSKIRSKKYFTSAVLLPQQWSALKAHLLKHMNCSEGKSEQYFDLTSKKSPQQVIDDKIKATLARIA